MECVSCGNPVPAGFKEFCSRPCFRDHMRKGSEERAERYAGFARAIAEAEEAGRAALAATVPVPMVVEQHARPFDDASPVTRAYVVEGGACGFAWVTVPGTGSFAAWARKHLPDVRKEYYGGILIRNVREGGQSMARKSEFARAYAAKLREHGIAARPHDRID